MTDFILIFTIFIVAACIGALLATNHGNPLKSRPRAKEQRGPQSEKTGSNWSFTVSLSDLNSSAGARLELSRLKHGDPVWLENCSDTDSGIARVKVYSGGFMIGQILLEEAEWCSGMIARGDIVATFVESASPQGASIRVFHRVAVPAPAYRVAFNLQGRKALFIQN